LKKTGGKDLDSSLSNVGRVLLGVFVAEEDHFSWSVVSPGEINRDWNTPLARHTF
jgi:hypothetical protein